MNKSKSLRSRKQVKSVLKTQYGGNTGAVLAEDGELFKDEYGQIQEIVGFTHESPFTQDEEGNLYYTGEGGQIVRAQSVLSDSYEKVKEGTRKSTNKEDTLKIKPKEARELFDFKWFKPTGKTYSPSSLVKDVATQRDKHLSRYDESRQNDSVSRDTNLLNESMLPSDDDIYEKVFDRQERVKGRSGRFEDTVVAKSGIHINPENRGKFNATKKRTGKTTEELTHSKNPLTRKRAIFAQNAKKWKKGQYGNILSTTYTDDEGNIFYSSEEASNYGNMSKREKKRYLKNRKNIPVSPQGLWKYPDQSVIVPSGDITMEGIDYPVNAYDANTGEYLETMQPNMNYNFDTDNVLEVPIEELNPKEKVRQAVNKEIEGAKVGLQEVRRILANAKHGGMPKAQIGYDNTSRTPDRRIKINGTDRTLNPEPYKPDHYVDQYGDVWKLEPNGEYTKTNLRHQETIKPQPASYSEYMTNADDKYVVRRGDWISSVAPMFGLTEQELIELNPELSETGKIVPGMEINVMRPQSTVVPTNVSQEPVDRSDEINNIEELPEDINIEADQVTPDLKIEATTVPANTPEPQVVQEARKLLDKQRLGRLDRTQGTFAIREGMMQNRSVNLPYKMEVPRRTLGYVEEDVTPYLDEIDTSVNQQLQNINQNTAQGQAIMASVLNNANRAKRQTINQVNQANLQRRQQVDNQNNMLQNQFDLQQEQSNKQYVDETYETLAARDRNRMEVANAMDALVNQNSRLNNTFLLENIKNPNFQIDPITGEIYRIGTPLKDVFNKTSTAVTKAKWGKRHNRRV